VKTRLVITDLTRMHGGRVCIAGYTGKKVCVRPVLPPPGIPESSLYQDGRAIVYPFAVVDMDLLGAVGEPPHTEDQLYDLGSLSFVREVHSREQVLEWSLFDSVAAIFELPIQDDLGFYVMSCQGLRSMGTVQPQMIRQAIYERGVEGAWDYRLVFSDQAGAKYRLKITDLTWHYYCNSVRDATRDPKRIATELSEILRSRKVYLRIGLARGWQKFPDRCFLQITGIYTFPDYLDGFNFADLVPKRADKGQHG
jgi:hypothetical protein